MKTLISIIIPVYNVEKYLAECFETVANQTYRNIEIILVDDGSTDNSGVIADRLAESDPRAFVVHKTNRGLSDARNVGMRLAKGEYITFIDSDDYVDKKFIEKLFELAKKTDADIVQCENTRDVDRIGRGSKNVVSMSGLDAFIELMKFRTVSPPAWGKLYKLSLFRNNNLEFPFGRLHEDTAILYKLIYFARTFACLDAALYYYRINDSSIMTSTYTKNHYESVVKYHDELDEFIDTNQISISTPIVYRHKTLRILSVLNKLALGRGELEDAYKRFRSEYVRLFIKSRSIVCVLGIIPVLLPTLFRIVRQVNPLIRNVLGKT